MQAIVYDTYGTPDVLRLRQIDRPAIGDGDVLVRVRAVSLNALDKHFLGGMPYIMRLGTGLRAPKRRIPGVDLAGEVEAVGAGVTRFRPGDAVVGIRPAACAEYVRAGESDLLPKPAALSFEQAAAVPTAGITALQALRDKGKVRPGQRVLVNGAAGGVGTFAVQIAKAFGAHVTAVCSTGNLDLARSLGADQVIDYTREDFTRAGQRYDLIVDIAGNRSFADLRRALVPGGAAVLVGAGGGRWIGPLLRPAGGFVVSLARSRKMRPFLASDAIADLAVLLELIEAGRIAPAIDRTYPLAATAEAMRHLATGHARAKIVITVCATASG